MANYYGVGRSNYVRVSDLEKAKKIALLYGCTLVEKEEWVTFVADTEDGDVNSGLYLTDEEDIKLFLDVTGKSPDNPIEFYHDQELPDFAETVAGILEPNEVFVWVHAGSEKSRYINAYGVAINSLKERVLINLDSIYEQAAHLGSEITIAAPFEDTRN